MIRQVVRGEMSETRGSEPPKALKASTTERINPQKVKAWLAKRLFCKLLMGFSISNKSISTIKRDDGHQPH